MSKNDAWHEGYAEGCKASAKIIGELKQHIGDLKAALQSIMDADTADGMYVLAHEALLAQKALEQKALEVSHATNET